MVRSLTRRSAAAAALVLGAGAAVTAGAADAAGSSFDPGFGVGGKVVVQTDKSAHLTDLAVQKDGAIVAVGTYDNGSNDDGLVFRLRPNGKLDTAFGFRRFDLGYDERATAVVVQQDGKIVVVGSTVLNYDAWAWRLNADGTPDQGFGSNSVHTIDSAAAEYAEDVALTPDGKIVVAGATTAGDGVMAVYRLTTSGQPDSSFDDDGASGVDETGFDFGYGVEVQADGKVLVTGWSDSVKAAVWRLTESGAIDGTYGTGGHAKLPVTGYAAYDLVRAPAGGAYVTTETGSGANSDAVVLRLTAQGVVDPAFGGAGGARIDLGAAEFLGRIAVLPNGSVVGTGETSVGYDGLVVQLTPKGARDSSFAPNGVLTLGGPLSYGASIAAQPDGKVVIGGDDGFTTYHPLVYRLLGSSKPPVYCAGKRATIVGTAGANRLTGTAGPDVIAGLGGNDVVKGLGGRDVVCGGSGRDTLYGGSGNDALYGQAAADHLYGGTGDDRLVGGLGRDVAIGGPGRDRISGAP